MRKKELSFLSKSKYMNGLQCPKLLWYQYNRKEEIPPFDENQKAIFDEGSMVGVVAHKLFPGGVLLERELIPEKHHEKSIEAMKLKVPLFEAGFAAKRLYALSDILAPVSGGLWDLYEVKSSTKIKPEFLNDIAFQKLTFEAAGINIRKCFLLYINNQYVRKGEIDPEGLFVKVDLTNAVDILKEEADENSQKFLSIIGKNKSPEMNIGPHCTSPYYCPLQDVCWKFIPEKNSVFVLYSGRKLAFELVGKGCLDILHLPKGVKLNDKQVIQVQSHKRGRPHIDKEGLKQFIKKLVFPLYFLDFETLGSSLPAYDIVRPYEAVPFQYSLHVVEKAGARPKHFSYLAEGRNDPRKEILKGLKDLLGKHGSIVAYAASFEKGVIHRMVKVYPEFRKWAEKTDKRFVDLLAPFRRFLCYHPVQEGSNSIKAVLPAVTKTGYEELEIGEGQKASREYYRVTFMDGVAEDDRVRVRTALEKYCCQDTYGMIDILKYLEKVSF